MSVVAKGAAVAGSAGAGTWITLTGWPAVAAVALALVAGIAILLWVIASDERTSRVLSLISALRFQRR